LLDKATTFVVAGSKLAAIAAPMPRDAPVIRICVFIGSAFHSAGESSTKVIEEIGQWVARFALRRSCTTALID
jgi:hypothetical protein